MKSTPRTNVTSAPPSLALELARHLQCTPEGQAREKCNPRRKRSGRLQVSEKVFVSSTAIRQEALMPDNVSKKVGGNYF
ncbi:hypothetical protein C0J52_22504 [Blattella germanica]|nr:hypothetical protein C0J52_22504 [Blattella germanica]